MAINPEAPIQVSLKVIGPNPKEGSATDLTGTISMRQLLVPTLIALSVLFAAPSATIASVVWKACSRLEFKKQQPRIFNVAEGRVEDREMSPGSRLGSLVPDSNKSVVIYLSVQKKEDIKASCL